MSIPKNKYSDLPSSLKRLATYLNSQKIRYEIKTHTFPTIKIINSPWFFQHEFGNLIGGKKLNAMRRFYYMPPPSEIIKTD